MALQTARGSCCKEKEKAPKKAEDVVGTRAWPPAAQPNPSQLKADARSVPSGELRPQRRHGVRQEGSGVGRGNGTASSPKNTNKLALLRSIDRLSSTPFPNTSLFPAAAAREPNPKPFHTRFAGFVLFIARVWYKWGSRRGRGTVSLQPCLQSLILGRAWDSSSHCRQANPFAGLRVGAQARLSIFPSLEVVVVVGGGLWVQKRFVRLCQTLTLFRATGSARKDANSIASFCLAPWNQEQKAPMEAVGHLQLVVGKSPEPCSWDTGFSGTPGCLSRG